MSAEIPVVGGAIVRGREVLAARRGEGMSLSGQWEFPGGKIESGEEPREALARELFEELGVHVEVGELIGRSTFTTAERIIVLDVYWCTITEGELDPREHSELRWLTRDELPSLDWAIADIPIVSMICNED